VVEEGQRHVNRLASAMANTMRRRSASRAGVDVGVAEVVRVDPVRVLTAGQVERTGQFSLIVRPAWFNASNST
jgi:hypothetical protein